AWALDWKGIKYETIDLVPGPHVLVTKKLAQNTTVPILKNGETIIQDSTHILDYLDSIAPKKVLTPTDTKLSLKALELEEYFDEKIGPHLRRYFYYYILPDSTLAKKLLLHQAPDWAKISYVFLFPLVRLLMKKGMNISETSAARSLKILDEALGKLNNLIQKSKSGYLIGDSFSRADLTAASLLAPLCLPTQHPFKWPAVNEWPSELIKYQEAKRREPFFKWVLDIYSQNRVF
ncbi:MAG: hypothetical protein ACD_73C00352G0003, partial [uncultured bacterium]